MMTHLNVSSPIPVPKKKPVAVASLSIGAGSNPYDRTVFAKRHSQFFKVTANRWLSKSNVEGLTITVKPKDDKKEDKVKGYDWIHKPAQPGSPLTPDDKDYGVLSSNYFLKTIPFSSAYDTFEQKQQPRQDENKTEKDPIRRSALKSLLSHSLRRYKSAEDQQEQAQAQEVEAKRSEVRVEVLDTEAPQVQQPPLRPPLLTEYRAPEQIEEIEDNDCCARDQGVEGFCCCDKCCERRDSVEMPATPRPNHVCLPRFKGPSMWQDELLLPPRSINKLLIERSMAVTPTVQPPADACLRRKVTLRSSPLRQATGVFDLHNLEYIGSNGEEDNDEDADYTTDWDVETASITAVNGIDPIEEPVQQRRRSSPLMTRVLKREFRKEVKELLSKKTAAQKEKDEAERPVTMVPRRSRAAIALRQLANRG